jgi:hypothetical protein
MDPASWIRRRIAEIFRLMRDAPCADHPKEVTREIEHLLKEVDWVLGGLPDSLSRRRRALLLTPRNPVYLNLEVYEYVALVACGYPVSELEGAVLRTGSPELMRRFIRYASGDDRVMVQQILTIIVVMAS